MRIEPVVEEGPVPGGGERWVLRATPARETAIDARLHQLQMDHAGTPEERQALSDALGGLRVLGREIGP